MADEKPYVPAFSCRLCGRSTIEAARHGAYLFRVNPKGEASMVLECRPSCDGEHGGQEEALLGAITGDDDDPS